MRVNIIITAENVRSNISKSKSIQPILNNVYCKKKLRLKANFKEQKKQDFIFSKKIFR